VANACYSYSHLTAILLDERWFVGLLLGPPPPDVTEENLGD